MTNEQEVMKTRMLKRIAEIVEGMNTFDETDRVICTYIALHHATLELTGIDLYMIEQKDRIPILDGLGITPPVFREFIEAFARGKRNEGGEGVH